jgi:putative transposase
VQEGIVARLGRYFVEGQALHVIQRGNHRQAIFYAEGDYALYRDWLAELAARLGVRVHAWVLMTNHVHLLLTPGAATGLPQLMQSLGRRYVGAVNRVYRRTGTLWEGRYRAAPVESGAHLMTCYRYIELNPVRARMVASPGDYPWSSHRAHATGAADPLVVPHEVDLSLGRDGDERQAAYRGLFATALAQDAINEQRQATHGGWAIGSERFKAQIAESADRRAGPLPKGRKPAGVSRG